MSIRFPSRVLAVHLAASCSPELSFKTQRCPRISHTKVHVYRILDTRHKTEVHLVQLVLVVARVRLATRTIQP